MVPVLTAHKAERAPFLRRNPFPNPYTLGFYYREKMRAIHAVTPEGEFDRVLELGGGQSGLTSLLFPHSEVVNLDLNAAYAWSPQNCRSNVRFVCGNAESLPFRENSFAAVTLFDVLEHVPNDRAAVREVLRVLRPGGIALVSTPNLRWRFPYYRFFNRVCPSEDAVMGEWGHVRRGYSSGQLQALFGSPCEAACDFINRLTVISHDLAFSCLAGRLRRLGCAMLWPLTWTGYWAQGRGTPGTETVTLWRKGAVAG
jgi:SAM-dependent methyltransferase